MGASQAFDHGVDDRDGSTTLALAGAAIAAWLITRQPAEQPLDLPSVAQAYFLELLAQSRVESAYFVVARRGKNASARS